MVDADITVEESKTLKEAATQSKPKRGRPKGSTKKNKQSGAYKPKSKPAKTVGYKGHGRPQQAFSLIPQLRELLQRPARDTVMTNDYCKTNKLDANKTTIAKVLLHSQLFWALEGSAPHMQQIMDRIDGKPMMRVEAAVSGKMDVTSAMLQMMQSKDN